MHELILLKESFVVNYFDILDFKQGVDFYYLKMNVFITDGTFLSIRLYVSNDDYGYSFHWQDCYGKLIIRWDNSPHQCDLATYPHHKHVETSVEASRELSLGEVLSYIETVITETNSSIR